MANLEDHLGDILSKARLHAGVEAPAAALAIGLSDSDYEQLERDGLIGEARLDWKPLATLLNLSPEKLLALAQGWEPQAANLSHWRHLHRFTSSAEGITVHCYLLWDEVTREAALFDTGWDAKPIIALIEQEGLTLRHLFLTHSHPDHLAELAALRAAYPKLLLHTNSKSAPVQHRNRPNDFTHLGSLRITNRDTPGHAEDGVTYLIGNWPDDAPHVAIVGDAIFGGSMGRGNISAAQAVAKVKEQILTLPADTLICPGHGPFTTVGEELAHNPFF